VGGGPTRAAGRRGRGGASRKGAAKSDEVARRKPASPSTAVRPTKRRRESQGQLSARGMNSGRWRGAARGRREPEEAVRLPRKRGEGPPNSPAGSPARFGFGKHGAQSSVHSISAPFPAPSPLRQNPVQPTHTHSGVQPRRRGTGSLSRLHTAAAPAPHSRESDLRDAQRIRAATAYYRTPRPSTHVSNSPDSHAPFGRVDCASSGSPSRKNSRRHPATTSRCRPPSGPPRPGTRCPRH
jgi:hypothetical protein